MSLHEHMKNDIASEQLSGGILLAHYSASISAYAYLNIMDNLILGLLVSSEIW